MATINLGKIQPVSRGEYSNDAAYTPMDYVTYNDSMYWCIAPCTGVAPSPASDSNWILIGAGILGLIEDAAPKLGGNLDLNGHIILGQQSVSPTDTPEFAGLTINGNPVSTAQYNDIGIAGKQDYGVGICPTGSLPPGMTLLPGTETPGHDNWGNYQFQEGSVVCCVPIHWIKIGTGNNGLPVNEFSVLKYSAFTSESAANSIGYFIPRCFIDGGEVQMGYFVDKYQASKNPWGTGYVASSLKNGLPISAHPDHNPIADLTACTENKYWEVINAAHARDGVDGAVNPNSNWFTCSRFIYVDLAMLSMAHGQAAESALHCAWFDPNGLTNFPKGCNNNALGDSDDSSVVYESDDYSNCGKTGSGLPFAKTTHNGQVCGVADLNGNLAEVSIGATCIAVSKSITAVSLSDPCELTVAEHGITGGQPVQIAGIVGPTELNDKIYTVTVIDDNTISLDGVDSSGLAVWESGGTCIFGTFYVAKESTAMKDFTSGNNGATDHWGAVGCAAMMQEFYPVFVTDYPNNSFVQRMGSEVNQVLSENITGNGAALRSLGVPVAGGADLVGTNQFGQDYFYQYIKNELCVLSGGSWRHSAYAGVWSSHWHYYRTVSSTIVGFRAACFPVWRER